MGGGVGILKHSLSCIGTLRVAVCAHVVMNVEMTVGEEISNVWHDHKTSCNLAQ